MTSATVRNEGVMDCGKSSRAMYAEGCRCFKCRVANANYERDRMARKRGELPKGETSMVSAALTAKARKRVMQLLGEGHSLREICAATGVPRSSMRTLVSGKHINARTVEDGRQKPSRRMCRDNYRKIMGCKRFPTPDGQLVDAAGYWRAVDYLLARGFTRSSIAAMTGTNVRTMYGKRSNMVTFGRYRKLAAVAEDLKAMADREVKE